MSNAFDKLNLRPFERRLVVVVGIALFIVVQIMFVWPQFGGVGRMDTRRDKALKELETRRQIIDETNKFVADLKKLEGEGSDIPAEDQAVQLMRAIQTKSSQSRVQIQNTSKPFTTTNQFFMEQSLTVATVSDEGSLVDFLYNLGTDQSLIRVRDLTLRRDQSQTKLNASIKLVASYQKKPGTTRTAAPAKGAPAKPAPATSTATRKK
jgi:type II secretory pathway component PulM